MTGIYENTKTTGRLAVIVINWNNAREIGRAHV